MGKPVLEPKNHAVNIKSRDIKQKKLEKLSKILKVTFFNLRILCWTSHLIYWRGKEFIHV